MYVYIYIEREMYISIYKQKHMYIYIYISAWGGGAYMGYICVYIPDPSSFRAGDSYSGRRRRAPGCLHTVGAGGEPPVFFCKVQLDKRRKSYGKLRRVMNKLWESADKLRRVMNRYANAKKSYDKL